MRTTFPKAEPTIVKYRDFSKYDSEAFGINLDTRIGIQLHRNKPLLFLTLPPTYHKISKYTYLEEYIRNRKIQNNYTMSGSM